MAVQTASERIKHFIMQQFPLARTGKIAADTPLLTSGVLDSLGILEVVTFLESEFRITLNDEELVPDNFHSIERIAAFVQSKMHDASVSS